MALHAAGSNMGLWQRQGLFDQLLRVYETSFSDATPGLGRWLLRRRLSRAELLASGHLKLSS